MVATVADKVAYATTVFLQFFLKDSIFAICFLKNDSIFAKKILSLGIYEKSPTFNAQCHLILLTYKNYSPS